MAIERVVYRADRRVSDADVHRIGSVKHAGCGWGTRSDRRREPAERSTYNQPLVRRLGVHRAARELRTLRQFRPQQYRRTWTTDSECRVIQIVSYKGTDVLPGSGELYKSVQSRE